MNKEKKMGLVLGSGGGKGFMHIGVLKTLQENDITPDYVVGSSIGALIGALFCRFGDYKKVEDIVLNFDWKDFSSLLSLNINKGILDSRKVVDKLNVLLESSDFDDLEIPFESVATNFYTAQAHYFDKGSLAEAVYASMAFPMLIEPLKREDGVFWDGGLSDPLPVERARKKTDVVLAVNLDKYPQFTKNKIGVSPYKTTRKAIKSLQHHFAAYCGGQADVLLEPEIEEEGFLSISRIIKKEKGRELIEKGSEITSSKLSIIKSLK